MCRPHWRMVPAALRAAVWKAYRPGQCDDKRPSEAWFVAADAAIAAVARAELAHQRDVSAQLGLGFLGDPEEEPRR
jgi:hypothetical protein